MLKTSNLIAILSFMFAFVSCVSVYAQPARYSGSGRNPPRSLSEERLLVMDRIIGVLPEEEDPYEIIGLILVESMLTQNAISRTGDYGFMQINCRVWRDWLRTNMDIQNCEEEILHFPTNIEAGVRVLNIFKRHRNCRGSNVYACYNGGPRWRSRAQRREAECEDDACRRRVWRPQRYQSSVLKHIRFLRRTYSERIDRVASQRNPTP